MFFRKFHSFQGSSTIRSALWENADPSLAAVGLLLATADLKTTLSALLVAAGEGTLSYKQHPLSDGTLGDGQPDAEAELQAALIAMIPRPGGSHDERGLLVRNLLAEFLRGFSLLTLIFPLDMVLPQIDAYHAGRQLQHLQSWLV